MRFAVLPALLALGGCAHSLSADRASLVLSEWAGFSNLRQPAEWGCNKSNTICLDGLADVQFVNSETITGPNLPSSFVAETVFHSEPRAHVRLLLAVRDEPSGRRSAIILNYVGSTAEQACLDAHQANHIGVQLPSTAQRTDDRVCFSEY